MIMINRVQFALILTVWILVTAANAETEQVRDALVQFMTKISPGNIPREPNWGWNTSSDPCNDDWKGIECYNNTATVKKIVLNDLNLTGVIDAASLCAATALTVVSLNSNGVVGTLPEDISKCSRLTHIYLRGNSLSGSLPVSLSRLSNLKRIVVSNNGFSGGIPDLSRISGLLTFFAENNQLSGGIPQFDFSNLEEFNVSNNDLTGQIPEGGGRFSAASFLGNLGLCGPPLPNACPPPPPPPPPPRPSSKKSSSKKDYFIYSGYALIGLIVLLLVVHKLMKKTAAKEKEIAAKKGFQRDSRHDKISGSSSESKAVGENRSEFSITNSESGKNSSSLMVLSSPLVDVLKFEDLLRSPAELINRGRHGSLYKVTVDAAATLAVKRIRDWDIARDEFKNRMHRIDQVKHPHLIPILAFYCSSQEKLLVYEFQENGSLFSLLHGSQTGKMFDWGSRLNLAAKVAEALAFMHQGLKADGIAHGNLKSSNILLSREMEPLISEYGLAEADQIQDQSFLAYNDSFQENNAFRADTYSFGVILLELLTGKVVQNNGFELARWVNSAIREEWTVEVFDKALVAEGTSEERMVQLLQLALKCINTSSDVRPSIAEVAEVINSIREQDEKSITSDS
ncbi:hypothetical protein C2S53_000788 [Perilla frutescens var. hirtella]|uniref:Protein kinase domain-containing protein n=1 Tax=Perilla frutescens var. hirtella TaxID=608512 RepID=A0AAD4IUA6_PERFH|nr:hypothetical protein C2S53_000788 [Perilla frutescens var. hirtella]